MEIPGLRPPNEWRDLAGKQPEQGTPLYQLTELLHHRNQLALDCYGLGIVREQFSEGHDADGRPATYFERFIFEEFPLRADTAPGLPLLLVQGGLNRRVTSQQEVRELRAIDVLGAEVPLQLFMWSALRQYGLGRIGGSQRDMRRSFRRGHFGVSPQGSGSMVREAVQAAYDTARQLPPRLGHPVHAVQYMHDAKEIY